MDERHDQRRGRPVGPVAALDPLLRSTRDERGLPLAAALEEWRVLLGAHDAARLVEPVDDDQRLPCRHQ